MYIYLDLPLLYINAYDCIFRYFVVGLYPPELQFTISVIIEQRVFLTKNGCGVWDEISRLEIGPQKRTSLSNTHMVNIATRCHLLLHEDIATVYVYLLRATRELFKGAVLGYVAIRWLKI